MEKDRALQLLHSEIDRQAALTLACTEPELMRSHVETLQALLWAEDCLKQDGGRRVCRERRTV